MNAATATLLGHLSADAVSGVAPEYSFVLYSCLDYRWDGN
jgi:hypothetical protein